MTSGEEAETPEWPVSCSACGAGIGGLPSGDPCPDCGETERTYLVTAGDTARAEDSAQASVTYVKDRPWQELWRAVLKGLADLEDVAARRIDPPSDWRTLPTEFCKDVWHLKDWLRNDPAVPQVARDSVDGYAKTQPGIALARDVANTSKHLKRNLGQREAYATGGTVTEESASFRIEWTDTKSGVTGTEDALTKARQAVQEWRSFFADHGLDETAA
ncbi:hypothetical protein E6W39_06520 [Kitasatospora acidiphila]|uniref:Uncharacterized protein n=1 Tax=Kitasatospora acidiphila TaxID=2567942 RepID=A0A540VZ32_9ACTN|nr:hypothetical protein [Kitasatospora acidiphila]TQF01991.1 hypothetical protein E6W39_06520 [Kitasatospora acidiphila]